MKFSNMDDYEEAIYNNMKIFKYLAYKYGESLSEYGFKDLIHEQIIACIKAKDKYDGKRNIGTFFYSVGQNRLRTMYRYSRRKKRAPKKLVYADLGAVEALNGKLEETTFNYEQEYIRHEKAKLIHKYAKEELTLLEYKVFKLYYVDNMDKDEIAKKIGKPRKSVHNALDRGKYKLREKRNMIFPEV